MRYITAGESHGKQITVILEDVPSGIAVCEDNINAELKRRSEGLGRSVRQQQEHDCCEIVSGVYDGITTGSPVCIIVKNNVPDIDRSKVGNIARPGHADFAGSVKYLEPNTKIVRERASARETVGRVACGAIAKAILCELDVNIFGYAKSIGTINFDDQQIFFDQKYVNELARKCCRSCAIPDSAMYKKAASLIQKAHDNDNALGGSLRLLATGVCAGLGGYSTGAARLTSKIGSAIFSIPAVKSVSFGNAVVLGEDSATSNVDEFDTCNKGKRTTNNSGGIEGGVTNGMPIIVGASVKAPSSTCHEVDCFDFSNKQTISYTGKTRSDACFVESACIVAQSELAIVLADAYMDKFGHDTLNEIKENFLSYKNKVNKMLGE